MRKYMIWSSITILSILLLGDKVFSQANAPVHKKTYGIGLETDDYSRDKVKGITSDQIETMCLTDINGGQVIQHTGKITNFDISDEGIVIRDRRLIALFLRGLQNAFTEGTPPSFLTPTLKITYRQQRGKTKEATEIVLNHVLLGTDFLHALHELQKYTLQQLRRQIQAHHIERIRFYYSERTVTNASEAAALVAALEKVDEQAFAIDTLNPNGFYVRLQWKGGYTDVLMAIPAYAEEEYKRTKVCPLPPLLWKYFISGK